MKAALTVFAVVLGTALFGTPLRLLHRAIFRDQLRVQHLSAMPGDDQRRWRLLPFQHDLRPAVQPAAAFPRLSVLKRPVLIAHDLSGKPVSTRIDSGAGVFRILL